MGISFKRSELPVQENDYTPIPAGTYDVQMDTVEEKSTLSGGVQWAFKMKIVSTPGSGRTFFLNYNVENANKQTQDIARRDVAEIASAIGVGDDISLETMKTNKVFTINLEQRVVGDKVYYNAKKWQLKDKLFTPEAFAKAATAPVPGPAKKKPWESK